jgi:antitoxin MazE
MTTVRTKIIPIGNSQGVRLPKLLLEQSGLGGEVELELDRDRIVIQPVSRPRQGWDQAFRAMAEQGEDRLLDEDLTGQSSWDANEWEW